jgi:hypothetical protein
VIEISVLIDNRGLPLDHVFIWRGHNITRLLGPYKDQDPIISGDAYIIYIESKLGKLNYNLKKNKTKYNIEFPFVSGDYSLEYYNDPCLLNKAYTLEYYLNVHSPSWPC